jgi:hypothetical protein
VLLHRLRERDDVVERVRKHEVERELLLVAVPLRVVHRAHVERGDMRALTEVVDALAHWPGATGGPVDEDGAARLDLVHDLLERVLAPGRRAIVVARVDVDNGRARVVGALGFVGDLDRRVWNRRAVLLRRDGPRQRARDDDLVRGHGRSIGEPRAPGKGRLAGPAGHEL